MTNDAANRLLEAARTKTPCAPVREIIGETDLAAAYGVQDILTEQRLADGGRLVGRKIGLTAKSVQQQLGVDQPDYGMLFADMDVMTGGEIPWPLLMQPKVEAEIAFVVGTDLTDPTVTTAEVLSAIDYALPALEIVGSRIANWDIRITDTIADNASASHFVLGHGMRGLDQVDLLDCAMTMTVNGNEASRGAGRACLGSPVNATVWLAQKMAQVGKPLHAGDVVLAGALGPMAPVAPGDHVVANIEGFGEVSVAFGKE